MIGSQLNYCIYEVWEIQKIISKEFRECELMKKGFSNCVIEVGCFFNYSAEEVKVILDNFYNE